MLRIIAVLNSELAFMSANGLPNSAKIAAESNMLLPVTLVEIDSLIYFHAKKNVCFDPSF